MMISQFRHSLSAFTQTVMLCVILLVPAAVGSQVTAGREIVTVITSDAVNHGPAPGAAAVLLRRTVAI